MYFDAFRSGHDALGVTGPSTTWLFAEGFTGGNAQTAFETFLLLANTGTTDTVATVDYLLDNGQVVTRTYPLLARQRFTVWVDQEGRTFDTRLTAAAFGIRVTAASPIVAERAMYWGTPSAGDPSTPTFPWPRGMPRPALLPVSRSGPSPRASRAPSARPRPASTRSSCSPIRRTSRCSCRRRSCARTARASSGRCAWRPIRATTSGRPRIPELAGQRFATFLESINSADPACAAVANTGFVAERAVYSGAGFLAGHVNGGTRWTGTIATPPVAPAFAVTSVSPSSGRLGGGQSITITGAGFQQGAKVYFDNSTWTADRNANTKLADVDQAADVVVSPDGTTITAKTPARDFYNGYQTAGPTTVRVVNPDTTTTSLANGFTFKLNVLAFGDDFVYGSVPGGRRGDAVAGAPRERAEGLPEGRAQLQHGRDDGHQGAAVRSVRLGDQCRRGRRVRHRRSVPGAWRSRATRASWPLAGNPAATNRRRVRRGRRVAEGVNDIEAGVTAGSVQFVLRDMVASARDRKIVILLTKFEETNVGSLDSGQVKALGDAIWNVTTDTSLNVEIYRQPFFRIATSGGYPTQGGYDQMASDVLTKLTREFPLQPCDARNDKPGKGCPRNP